MKKRIIFGILAAAVLLGGCGNAETFETVADEMDVPVLARPRSTKLFLKQKSEKRRLKSTDMRLEKA